MVLIEMGDGSWWKVTGVRFGVDAGDGVYLDNEAADGLYRRADGDTA